MASIKKERNRSLKKKLDSKIFYFYVKRKLNFYTKNRDFLYFIFLDYKKNSCIYSIRNKMYHVVLKEICVKKKR